MQLKINGRQFNNVVVIGGTVIYRNFKLWCYQRRQSCQIDDLSILFSTATKLSRKETEMSVRQIIRRWLPGNLSTVVFRRNFWQHIVLKIVKTTINFRFIQWRKCRAKMTFLIQCALFVGSSKFNPKICASLTHFEQYLFDTFINTQWNALITLLVLIVVV